VKNIWSGAFKGSKKVVIYAPEHSFAIKYAKKTKTKYQVI